MSVDRPPFAANGAKQRPNMPQVLNKSPPLRHHYKRRQRER
jgi:hypothetical protein